MLHNHHSKSKGLKQLVPMFTTNHTFTHNRHQFSNAFNVEKKKEGEYHRLPLAISNRSFNLLSYE